MVTIFLYDFGRLASVVDLSTGKDYPPEDWRCRYIDTIGLIVQRRDYALEDLGPDQIFFFPYDDGAMDRRLHTSSGYVRRDETSVAITSQNSVYRFELDNAALPDEAKAEMFINCCSGIRLCPIS